MTIVDADRDARWTELQRLRQQGDWQGALVACSSQHDPLLLWLQPTRDVLSFIGREAARYGVRAIVSVGCGSGLFEWLLASSTGLGIVGVEVNREWWESRYSPPTFIPLEFSDEDRDLPTTENALKGSTDAGIMFCYFNDTNAFLEYMRVFKGRLLVVAGPVAGPDTKAHCHPHPFSTDIPSGWTLQASASIGNTGDAVAVYTR